ncbi:MAG: RidA family protein [Thermoanaerobaculia bacterium]
MVQRHDPSSVPAPQGGYALGLSAAPLRLLFISGQIPERRDGTVPEDFEAQCRLAWEHVLAVLSDAGLGPVHLLKVTTFLADRADAELNGRIRREVLGAHEPALTVVAVNTLDPRWLLEIEAIAGETGPAERTRDAPCRLDDEQAPSSPSAK